MSTRPSGRVSGPPSSSFSCYRSSPFLRPGPPGPGLLLPRRRRPGGLPRRRLHGPGRRHHGPLLQSRRPGLPRRVPDQDEHELLHPRAHGDLAGRRRRIHVLAERAHRELLLSWRPFKGITLGAGYYSPYNFDSGWPVSWSGESYAASAKLNAHTFRTALAVEPLKGLALSAALDVVSMSVDWDHRIPFELETYPLAHEVLVMSQHEAGGHGLGFAAGALWKVFSGLQVGARFQKSAAVDLSGWNTFIFPNNLHFTRYRFRTPTGGRSRSPASSISSTIPGGDGPADPAPRDRLRPSPPASPAARPQPRRRVAAVERVRRLGNSPPSTPAMTSALPSLPSTRSSTASSRLRSRRASTWPSGTRRGSRPGSNTASAGGSR